jgi:mevalonate kinase
MPIVLGKAPGKIILFGEHAVVYGHPAIAIPVTKVNATAKIFPNLNGQPGLIHLRANEINLDADLTDLAKNHPLVRAIQVTLEAVAPRQVPALTVQIDSSIPVSAGMGSSAAVSVAIIRALSAFLGNSLSPEEISTMAYDVEKLHHGTPSGIDNNVIAHQQPVYFVKGKPIRFLKINKPTYWVIGDTGEKTPTRETVSAVRTLYTADPQQYGGIFEKIGQITQRASKALKIGNLSVLGSLMNDNQILLEQLNVSSAKLESLIQSALAAGAFGAKLSGGGVGGNIIALVEPEKIEAVEAALIKAGATRTITTILARDGDYDRE